MRVGRGERTESSAPAGWDVEDAVPYSAKRCHCEPVTVSLVWQSVFLWPHWSYRADRVVRPYKETDSHASLRTGSE